MQADLAERTRVGLIGPAGFFRSGIASLVREDPAFAIDFVVGQFEEMELHHRGGAMNTLIAYLDDTFPESSSDMLKGFTERYPQTQLIVIRSRARPNAPQQERINENTWILDSTVEPDGLMGLLRRNSFH